MEDSCISAVPQPYIFGAKLNVVYDNVINMTSFGIPLHAALVETQGNRTFEIYALPDRAVRFIRHCDMCTVM